MDPHANVALAEIRSLATGVRIFAGAILLLIGGFGVVAALMIDLFRQIFQDMLQGKPLPLLTQLILNYSPLVLLFALVIPTGGIIAAAVVRHHALALGLMAGAAVLTLLLCAMITIRAGERTQSCSDGARPPSGHGETKISTEFTAGKNGGRSSTTAAERRRYRTELSRLAYLV